MRLICLLLFAGLLTGCAPVPTVAPAPVSSSAWTPPSPPPGEKYPHLSDYLSLLQEFAACMEANYPLFAPDLSPEDISYYEHQLASLSISPEDIAAELRVTSASLRQQVYRHIETACKTGTQLPEGLEETLREYERRFTESGL